LDFATQRLLVDWQLKLGKLHDELFLERRFHRENRVLRRDTDMGGAIGERRGFPSLG
jgi:hypothetical protein